MPITLPVSGSTNWDVPLNTALTNLQSQAVAAQTTANGAVTSSASKVAVDALVYNVKDHGAVGNNSTDDTTAIQAAINLATANGGVVYFPPAIYRISASLSISSGITLLGTGFNSVINQVNTSSDVFVGTDVSHVTFDSLKITGPGTGTGIGIHLNLSTNTTTIRPLIRNIYVQAMGGDGINVSVPVFGRIDDSYVVSCGGYGFNVFGTSTPAISTTIVNCYASSCPSGGYRLFTANGMSLIGCYALSCVIGFLINVCNGTVIESCYGDTCGTGVKVNAGSSNTVMNYYSNNNTGLGVWLTGNTLMASIDRALDVSPNGTATHFIQVDSGSFVTINGAINVTSNLFNGTVNIINDGTTGTITSSGNIKVGTAGNTLYIKEGTNAKMGTATLVAGAVTINTTAVTASSRILLTGQNSSGTAGNLTVSSVTAGTSFTITSTSNTDTRLVAWLLIEPA